MAIELQQDQVERYLQEAFGQGARLTGIGSIGSLDEQGMKGFGYGKPVRILFEVDGERREAVLSSMRGDKYGHQFYWDRAAILMFQYETSAKLKHHVRPVGLGYVDEEDRLHPLHGPREFFILNEKLEGYDYFLDLERIRKGDFRDSDLETARSLSRWLAEIHADKKEDPDLYYRSTRDLIGSSECILGLVDEAYPHPYGLFSDERFLALEKRLLDWRWKLRGYAHRLCAVHGDFHPWNILVRGPSDFSVLDRSRGEWGEPAGDLATMAINYLLYGLYDEPRLTGPFEKLYLACFEEYLDRTGDLECLEVIAPFFVFRGLVIASPEWYPTHPASVRGGLFRFLENVLEDERFDYANINKYME